MRRSVELVGGVRDGQIIDGVDLCCRRISVPGYYLECGCVEQYVYEIIDFHPATPEPLKTRLLTFEGCRYPQEQTT